MKRLYLRSFFIVGGIVLLSGCRKQQGPAIAHVGDAEITLADFKSRLQNTPPAYQQYAASPEGRKQFLNLLVREKVLLVQSRKAGFQKDPEYIKAVDRFKKKWERDLKDYQESLLIELYLTSLRSKELAVTDADIRRYYDDHSNDYQHPVEIQASHILVNTADEAARILERLKHGESFETLARALSMDPPTAVQGGRLKPFTKGNLMPEFENAVFPLKVGQLSGVVKTPFGYHIIKKISQRPLAPRSFDQAKDEIQNRLQREKFDQWVTKAQTTLGVKIDENALATVMLSPVLSDEGGMPAMARPQEPKQ